MKLRAGVLILAGLLLTLTPGCSKSVPTFSIHGKITNAGKPVTTSSKGFVQVSFQPAAGGTSTPFPAVVDSQQGTFTVDQIPQGRYKVAVQQMDPAPVTDKLKGAFSAGKTPIVREVTEDGEVNIDLARP
jgi:hypothetical protein